MDSDAFREALSNWATTVALAAVRDEGVVYGITLTSFTPVSVDPPAILISLGPSAAIVPFLELGTRLGVSLLTEAQGGMADDFADTFQVGPSPFSDGDIPLVEDALLGLHCTVRSIQVAPGRAIIVMVQVDDALVGGGLPLLYHQHGYRRLAGEE